MSYHPPPFDCSLCPRLVAFRQGNQAKFPGKHNAPVPAFGPLDAELLIVGLAPGLKGANFSGRPFTGDYAGDLLYATLLKFGYARGMYAKHKDDGLELVKCRVTNAVRCVPPENKPTTQEMNTCRAFLKDEIVAMPDVKVILSLGLISHNAVIKALGYKISAFKFAHGAKHPLSSSRRKPGSCSVKQKDSGLRRNDALMLIDSYHCSRYNTNTGRLTTEMFEDVFEKITSSLSSRA